MERILCLAMGYCFGLCQTGYFYGKMHQMDIRNYGSGNSGSTNVLRVMGVKAGLIVFIGDCSKMILACLVTRYLFRAQPDLVYLYLLYTGFGVILGHNFPFFMGFKGGKGIASTGGILLAFHLPMAGVLLAIFLVIAAITRYVSLASLITVTCVPIAIGICYPGKWALVFPEAA